MHEIDVTVIGNGLTNSKAFHDSIKIWMLTAEISKIWNISATIWEDFIWFTELLWNNLKPEKGENMSNFSVNVVSAGQWPGILGARTSR